MQKIGLILVVLMTALTSCGGRDEFVIKCDIADLGENGVEMYYVTDQGVRKSDFHPEDGKLTLRGSSKSPALVEVFLSGGGDKLFSCIAANGDKLTVSLDPSKPGSLTIKGNKDSEDYARFLVEHLDLISQWPSVALNDTIAEYVARNPRSLSSAVLLMTLFDSRDCESLADSLLQMVTDNELMHPLIDNFSFLVGALGRNDEPDKNRLRRIELPTGRDTIAVFTASAQSYGLMAFSSIYGKRDSLVRSLTRLYKEQPRKRFKAIEIYADGDSAKWDEAVKADSAKWVQAWVVGGIANEKISKLRVPALPFYIIIDSTGRELFRGRELRIALDTLEQRLRPTVVAEQSDSLSAK